MATEPDLDPLRTAAEQAYTRQPGEPSAGYISDTDALTATESTFDGIDLAVTYTTDTAAEIAVDITELQTSDQNLSDSLAAAVTTLEAADAATDAALAAAVTTLEAADAATDAALAAAVTDLGNRLVAEWDGQGWPTVISGTITREQSSVLFLSNGGPSPRMITGPTDVRPGETWTGSCRIANTSTENVTVRLLGAALLPNLAIVAPGTTRVVTLTAVLPADTKQLRLYVIGDATPAGEGWTITEPDLHLGSGGLACTPGQPVPNTGIRANADLSLLDLWHPGLKRWVSVELAPSSLPTTKPAR